MPRGLKQGNQYIELLGSRHFTHTPKSVLAAVAISLAMRLTGDNQEEARALFFDEWNTLSENGIVPQKCFIRKSAVKQTGQLIGPPNVGELYR